MRKTIPVEWYTEMCRQEYLYRCIIHNKINVTIRQSKESLYEYEKRVRDAQFKKGYSKNDWIIS